MSSSPSATVRVSSAALVRSLQISLQRLIDLVVIGFAGVPKIDTGDYEKPKQFASFNTAGNTRMPFSKAQEEFYSWCIKNTFTEAIDLTGVFLDECLVLARLSQFGRTLMGADWNDLMAEKRRFHEKGLPTRITDLKERFGISSALEPEILSLNRVRNCLVHRLGIVAPKDLEPGGFLVARWRELEIVAADPVTGGEQVISEPTRVSEGTLIHAGILAGEKKFAPGERVLFSLSEHRHAMLTFHLFATQVVGGVDKLKAERDQRLRDGEPPG